MPFDRSSFKWKIDSTNQHHREHKSFKNGSKHRTNPVILTLDGDPAWIIFQTRHETNLISQDTLDKRQS